jgi:hypothetical protein
LRRLRSRLVGLDRDTSHGGRREQPRYRESDGDADQTGEEGSSSQRLSIQERRRRRKACLTGRSGDVAPFRTGTTISLPAMGFRFSPCKQHSARRTAPGTTAASGVQSTGDPRQRSCV